MHFLRKHFFLSFPFMFWEETFFSPHWCLIEFWSCGAASFWHFVVFSQSLSLSFKHTHTHSHISNISHKDTHTHTNTSTHILSYQRERRTCVCKDIHFRTQAHTNSHTHTNIKSLSLFQTHTHTEQQTHIILHPFHILEQQVPFFCLSVAFRSLFDVCEARQGSNFCWCQKCSFDFKQLFFYDVHYLILLKLYHVFVIGVFIFRKGIRVKKFKLDRRLGVRHLGRKCKKWQKDI